MRLENEKIKENIKQLKIKIELEKNKAKPVPIEIPDEEVDAKELNEYSNKIANLA